MTEFGEKVNAAVNSTDAFLWKTQDGKTIKMMDADEETLIKWYTHCWEMLYSQKFKSPGKFKVRENIQKMWDSCNAELFVRYLIYECQIEIQSRKNILEFINKISETQDVSKDNISSLFENIPTEFQNISVKQLINACLNQLFPINKKIVTMKFAISQGIWLTQQELVELTEYDENNKIRNRKDVIKERLCLPEYVNLHISPSGLTYSEFRSILQLENITNVMLLPTTTLVAFRNKILLLLDNELTYHINKWQTLISQVTSVADIKEIALPILDND